MSLLGEESSTRREKTIQRPEGRTVLSVLRKPKEVCVAEALRVTASVIRGEVGGVGEWSADILASTLSEMRAIVE